MLLIRIILFLALFSLPPAVLAAEISFNDAKAWDFKNSEAVSDYNFDGSALSNWQDWQIATIDLGNDGNEELIVAAGIGSQPEIKILQANGQQISRWLAYDEKMLNGVELAIADLDNDGRQEIITGVGEGAGSHIRIFNSAGQAVLSSGWFAWPGENRGVKIIALQADNDIEKEIAAAIQKEDKILIKIFDYSGTELFSWQVADNFGKDFKIKRINLGGDSRDELIIAAGKNKEPWIYLYRTEGSEINHWLGYDEKFTGGLQISAIDLNGDNKDEIITAPQLSGGPHIKIFDGYGQVKKEFMSADQDNLAGQNFTIINNQVLFLPAHQTTGRTDLNKYIEIDISDQRLNYYNYYGIRTASLPVSTGTVQTPTPLGEYTIDYKEPNRFSRAYGLYMPYWMAFNVQKGYGIHELPYWPSGYKEGLNHLGQRVSHGCVRLGLDDAAWVYNQTPLGTKVFIVQ